MKRPLPLFLLLFAPQLKAQGTCPSTSPNEFKIELIRLGTDEIDDKGVKKKRVYGDIGVNNQNFGRFYETLMSWFQREHTKGSLRYQSNYDFVVSSCGVAAQTGDFLIEVDDVNDANGAANPNILFHPGFPPKSFKGCVLFGARKRALKATSCRWNQTTRSSRYEKNFTARTIPFRVSTRSIVVKKQ